MNDDIKKLAHDWFDAYNRQRACLKRMDETEGYLHEHAKKTGESVFIVSDTEVISRETNGIHNYFKVRSVCK